MKIADIHSFFVRRVTSSNKTNAEDFLVQAMKDSLHDREKRHHEQTPKDDAVLIHSKTPCQSPEERENDSENQTPTTVGILNLTA